MVPDHLGVHFEEDRSHFIKKKFKLLGLGLLLMFVPPVGLYLMFFELLRWSSLFERETGMILIFLIVSPFAGICLTFRGIMLRRFRIYDDRIPNPLPVGRRYIMLDEIETVTIGYSRKESEKVEITLKAGNWFSDRNLGSFLTSETSDISAAFSARGVKTGIVVRS